MPWRFLNFPGSICFVEFLDTLDYPLDSISSRVYRCLDSLESLNYRGDLNYVDALWIFRAPVYGGKFHFWKSRPKILKNSGLYRVFGTWRINSSVSYVRAFRSDWNQPLIFFRTITITTSSHYFWPFFFKVSHQYLLR
mgnify:CR=1 FL=1